MCCQYLLLFLHNGMFADEVCVKRRFASAGVAGVCACRFVWLCVFDLCLFSYVRASVFCVVCVIIVFLVCASDVFELCHLLMMRLVVACV